MDERSIASAVDRWARTHRSELVDDLKGLIAIPSIAAYENGLYPMGAECARAVDYLMELGRKYEVDAKNDDYYAVRLKLPGLNRRTELGILGHLDVVSAGTRWRHDPFDAYEERGYVFGRGSLDNKGPVIMALYVLRCMKELHFQLQSDVVLIAGCDEEKEMRDIAHYLSVHPVPDFTLICDGAWPMGVGEKGILKAELVQQLSGGNLLSLYGGGISNQIPDHAQAILIKPDDDALERIQRDFPEIQIESNDRETTFSVSGRTAHCSTPENGINAVLCMLDFLSDARLLQGDAAKTVSVLQKCFVDHQGTGLKIYHADSFSGTTTCVPTSLRLHDGKLHTQINVRYPLSQKPDLLVKHLVERCEQLGVEVRIQSHEKPHSIDLNDPVIQMLLANCKRHLSRKCKPYVSGGGTYARRFPNSIPYGPAYLDAGLPKRCGQPHSANECVSVDQLLEAIKVYVLALMKLDAYINQKNQLNSSVVPQDKT